MSETHFDKDIELLKINLLAEEWRGDFRDTGNYYLTALIALLAVELTVVIGIELGGNYWAGIFYFVVFVALEGPFFIFLLYRTGRRYRKKLRKVNELIKKVERGEKLEDFDTLMKKDKSVSLWRT